MSLTYKLSKFLWEQPWFNRHYGKSIYKRICKEGEAPDVPFTTDFFGLQYDGNLQNTIDFNIYYFGAFEKPLLFFMRDCLQATAQSPARFFDIGANIGQHSLYMSQFAQQIHSFEPYQPVRERLEHQVKLNALTNISVHPLGLSDKNQALPFFAPTGRNQGIGSFDASTVAKGNENIGELTLVIGDEYLAEQGIGAPSLIKIDVEGFEKTVLNGLHQTLTNHRPVVVCEVTYGNDLSFASLSQLHAAFPGGYQFFTFDTRKEDGSKARRRGAKSKKTGHYQLIPFKFDNPRGQDDIVACPDELVDKLPRSNLN